MHYLTVIAIDVPQTEENEAENLEVKECIKAFKENKPQEENFFYDYRLKELEEAQTTFARTVSDLAYEFMEPYGQDSENYQEFFDMTEELKHSYEHGKGDFIKTPDGRITSAFFVVGEHRFIIQDEKVYEQLGKGWKDRRFKRPFDIFHSRCSHPFIPCWCIFLVATLFRTNIYLLTFFLHQERIRPTPANHTPVVTSVRIAVIAIRFFIFMVRLPATFGCI